MDVKDGVEGSRIHLGGAEFIGRKNARKWRLLCVCVSKVSGQSVEVKRRIFN